MFHTFDHFSHSRTLPTSDPMFAEKALQRAELDVLVVFVYNRKTSIFAVILSANMVQAQTINKNNGARSLGRESAEGASENESKVFIKTH